MSDLGRALAFLRGIDERASTHVVPFDFGSGYLHPALPDIWMRNFVWVDGHVPDQRLEELVAEADRIHRIAGVSHRRLLFSDEPTGLRAADALQPAGWQAPHARVLVHQGDDQSAGDDAHVQEVDPDLLAPATLEFARTHPDVKEEQTAQQLLTAYGVGGRATDERCFALLVDGSVVAYCRLYSDGATAQVEDVATLPQHRRRGYAAAVVRRAIGEAADHEMTFVLALEDDWPRHWYERLGFRPLSLIPELIRPG